MSKHRKTEMLPDVDPLAGPGAGQHPPRDRAGAAAAAPGGQVVTSSPAARTMMYEPGPPDPRPSAAMATVAMSAVSEVELGRQRSSRRGRSWGRWIIGPLLAGGVAVGTAGLARVLLPKPAAPVTVGRLRLLTDPPGAAVLLDGQPYAKVTPTVVEAPLGATLRVGFRLDGYQPREADVYVAEGERPFRAKLEELAPAPPPDPDPDPTPTPAPTPTRRPAHRPSSRQDRPFEVAVLPEPTGALSVFVRPWAIVFVDGARLRQTPIQGYSLPVGKHVIELVNEGLNRRERIALVVRAGEPQEIRRDWSE